MASPSSSQPSRNPKRAARVRLPAEVRIGQILDAALAEFAAHGYAAARMDDIALRAGLSKGGLYAHFDSKEAVFEALLASKLEPMPPEQWLPETAPVTVDIAIELIIGDVYDRFLADAGVAQLVRLLIAEGPRAPHVVALWRKNVVEPHFARIVAIVQRGVAQGFLRADVVVEEPWLLIAPAVQVMVGRLCEGDTYPRTLAQCRAAHARLLRELLTPAAPAVR